MVYPIVVYGDSVLRKKALEIEKGKDVKTLVQDMFDTMVAAHGIGLAAPQIGKAVRLFVVDGTTLDEEPELIDFKKVFAERNKAGMKYFFVEQDKTPGSPFDSITKSFNYIKKNLV